MENTRIFYRIHYPQQTKCRSGSAPIEFAMVLVPVLLFVMMLLWMGIVGIQKSLVSIEARYDAWGQREDQAASPFEFRDAEQGRISATASRDVNLVSWLNDLISPKSSHVVYAGAWQYPHVDLNNSPNWNLQKKLAQKSAASKVGEIGDVAKSFGDIMNPLQDLSSQNFANVGLAMFGETGITGKLGELESKKKEADRRLEDEKVKAKKEAEEAIRKAKQEHKDTLNELDRVIDQDETELTRLRDREEELKESLKKEKEVEEPDEEKIKELEEEIDEAQEDIETVDDRLKRRKRGKQELSKVNVDQLGKAGP